MRKSSNLFCIFHGPCFADDGDFDLAGIGHLFFDARTDIFSEHLGFAFADFFGNDDYADLSAGLQGKAAFHPGEVMGDIFQLFKTFEIKFGGFTAGTGAGSTQRIADIDENIVEGFRFDFTVVGSNRVSMKAWLR